MLFIFLGKIYMGVVNSNSEFITPLLLTLLFLMTALFIGVTVILNALRKHLHKEIGLAKGEKKSGRSESFLYNIKNADRLISSLQTWSLLLAIAVAVVIGYELVNSGTSVITLHLMEWFSLLLRWAHIIFGIAWIGASFYFIFLENSLNRTKDLQEGIAGNLWAVHGGGFYYLEKYKTAPVKLPEKLHWFKYEAYFTWITGFLLLCIVYYFNASGFMIDKNVYGLTPAGAITIGIGILPVSWLFYDLLCRSALVNRHSLFMLVMILFTTVSAYLLCHVFSGRAAYIHIGAMLGTLMAANVFFVIIPSQNALVRAAEAGNPPDLSLGQKAGLRSLHNNYFTLPVVFIMISGHFPLTYSSEWNWAVLAGLSVAGVAVKHFWNLYEQGTKSSWVLPAAALVLIALAMVTAPKSPGDKLKNAPPVAFSQVKEIIEKRCVSCHSVNPTDDVWKTAPNNVLFDTQEQIVKMKDKILNRVVITKTMPQANKSGMLQEERDLIEIWIYQGAKIN